MDLRAQRIGENEVLFREVNEKLRGLNESFSIILEKAEFVCECADVTCTERVSITLEQYEQVRSDPRRFIIRKGHDVPDVETVVVEGEGFDVVEKNPGEAAALATEHDPRG
jgi:hypothetical protein